MYRGGTDRDDQMNTFEGSCKAPGRGPAMSEIGSEDPGVTAGRDVRFTLLPEREGAINAVTQRHPESRAGRRVRDRVSRGRFPAWSGRPAVGGWRMRGAAQRRGACPDGRPGDAPGPDTDRRSGPAGPGARASSHRQALYRGPSRGSQFECQPGRPDRACAPARRAVGSTGRPKCLSRRGVSE